DRQADQRSRWTPNAFAAMGGDAGTGTRQVNSAAPRVWPAALAALAGSTMVGVMPLVARKLYADGLGAPSMLFFRYVIALLALAIAIKAMRLDLSRSEEHT